MDYDTEQALIHQLAASRIKGTSQGSIGMNIATPTPRAINADQVAHIYDVLNRFANAMQLQSPFPRVSRLDKAARLAALLELMEILDLQADDLGAVHNALVGLQIPQRVDLTCQSSC